MEIKSIRISRAGLIGGCAVLTGCMVLIFVSCASTVYDQHRSTVPQDTQADYFRTFFMKQKVWTLGDHFKIVDEHGNPRFTVQGRVFSLGDRLTISDINGHELAFIKQELFSLGKQYRIFRNQKLWARVHKKITLFKDKYIIDVHGQDDYIISGDVTDHRYTCIRKGKPAAFITKKWFSWGDSYSIEIGPDEDDLLLLAIAIVIDMTSHDDESNTTANFPAIF